MIDKSELEKKRNRGGSADIGTEEDGAILEMINMGDKTIVVKEKALYEFMLADQIDPKRENPDIPSNVQRLLLKQGAKSPMVCKTFLTAKRLLRAGSLHGVLDTDRALLVSLEALQELAVMEGEINDYLDEEYRVAKEYEERKGKQMSYALPSVNEVVSHCKTIFQKADHVTQVIMEIITLFFPEAKLTKQSHLPKFAEFVKGTYGDDDYFTKFVDQIAPFFELVRAFRNCLDHRLKEVTVRDFEIDANGQPGFTVISPSIEIDYRGNKMERTSLSDVFPVTLQNLVDSFEIMIAHLCNKKAKKDTFFASTVLIVPEDQRRNKHIRYAFWSNFSGSGFYHQ